jgi:hypothetical protein
MERQKALIASVIVAVVLMTGAVAYAAGGGLIGGRQDNVGNLQTATTQPVAAPATDITLYVDPARGRSTPTTALLPRPTPHRRAAGERGAERGRRPRGAAARAVSTMTIGSASHRGDRRPELLMAGISVSATSPSPGPMAQAARSAHHPDGTATPSAPVVVRVVPLTPTPTPPARHPCRGPGAPTPAMA